MKFRFLFVSCIIYISLYIDSVFSVDEYSNVDESLAASTGRASNQIVKQLWMGQPMDHFNQSDDRAWNMRYFERDDMWQPGGPIIVYIGGEDEVDPLILMTSMLAIGLANETNGAAYISEHRYYGQSVPTLETMQYLSSRQALADLELLIRKLKRVPKYKDSKVVVIGGSYAGNLAAWMRLLYPHVVDAAISISAPVLAKLDFYEFMETVGDNYRIYGGDDCYAKIRSIFKKNDDLFRTTNGTDTLKREERICGYCDMSIPENQHLFTYQKSARFRHTSMLGRTEDIENHCNELMQDKSSISDPNASGSILRSEDIPIDWDRDNNCVNIDVTGMITKMNIMKTMGMTSKLTLWMYQMCSEFGYLVTTSSNNQPFGKNIPLSSFRKMFSSICGSKFNEDYLMKAIKKTNERYGGLTPNVTKVVFLNGDMDPWHRLGVTKDLSDEAPAILIPKSSHGQVILPTRDGDSVELINARQRAKALVKSWIGYVGK